VGDAAQGRTPAPPRYDIFDEPDGLRVVLRHERPWPLIAVFGFMLLAFSQGVANLVLGYARLDLPTVVLGPLVGGLLLYALGWSLFGREELLVDGLRLLARRQVGPFSRGRAFELGEVRGLRAEPPPWAGARGNLTWQRVLGLGGPLTLEYRGRTYRFGSGLEQDEAAQVAATLRARYPSLGQPAQG
jgi:hypothetical protein